MELLLNQAIYRRVILELLPQAQKFLWIVTADIKDLHVPKGRRFVPLLEILSDLIESGVAIRLMHAKEPGPRFRADFDRYPNLIESDLFERYQASLSIVPAPRPPVTDPRGEMFRILLESHRLAGPMLAADQAAAKGREYYDDGFYAAFRKEAFPTVDQRVADSIAASAAFIVGAWDTAGRPAVPTTLTRSPRRVPAPAPPK
jgi:hypothetical protein